jgi:cytochrome c peroxidase
MRAGASFLILALVTPAFVVGCRSEAEPAPLIEPGGGDEGTMAHAPITEQVQQAVKKATAHAVRFQRSVDAGEPDRAQYLEARRWIAAAQPYFRLRAQMGSEVLVGPQRSIAEAGGALGGVDAAMTAGDREAAKPHLVQVVRALRLIDHELAINEIPPKEAAKALSDTAYELGLALMEAYPGVPSEPDAVRADLQGMLLSIDRGVAAIDKLVRNTAPIKAARESLLVDVAALGAIIGAAADSHQLTDRGALVRRTGTLGVKARAFAKAVGVEVKLPYSARRPVRNNGADEPIHAFVVPSPRVDLRKGDRKAMIAIGRKLFSDKRLSKGGVRACIDCHQPDKGYSDGQATAASLQPGVPITRNTPTLLYTSLHAAQLWDGLFASAEQQAIKVIHTATEMGLTGDQLVATLAADEAMKQAFAAAFEDGLVAKNVGRALVAFEIDAFVPADSPLDRFARGDDAALASEHRAGLDVFGGVGRCARCHVPPLFGGSRPPDFSVPIFAVLGVPEYPEAKRLDTDRGRGKVTKQALDEHAFKTPTVRNIAATAPYMHHGRFETLEQVLELYDVGGGRGRGLEVPNQDPDVRKLELGDARKKAVLTFMREALADPR